MEEVKVQEQSQLEIPAKLIANAKLDRIGRIFFNMGITCGVLIFVSLLSTIIFPFVQFILIALTFVVLICLIVFSLGAAFVMPDSPLSSIWEFLGKLTNSTFAMDAVSVFIKAIPYLCIIGIVAAAISITMLSIGKQKGWIGKIVAISIFVVIMVFAIILYFVGGGALW